MIEETWPSPVALRLITNRIEPAGTPSCRKAGTIEGLKSATDSRAYSMVKHAPSRSWRDSGQLPAFRDGAADLLVMFVEDLEEPGVLGLEVGRQARQQSFDLRLGILQDPVDDVASSIDVPRRRRTA